MQSGQAREASEELLIHIFGGMITQDLLPFILFLCVSQVYRIPIVPTMSHISSYCGLWFMGNPFLRLWRSTYQN